MAENASQDSVIVLENPSGNLEIWEELNSMRHGDIMCDMLFTGVDGIPKPAHSCVVAASSDYLRSTLTNVITESRFVIQLPSVASQIIESMLTYIYTGKLSISSSLFINLEATAIALEINSLVNICQTFHQNTTMFEHEIEQCIKPEVGHEVKDISNSQILNCETEQREIVPVDQVHGEGEANDTNNPLVIVADQNVQSRDVADVKGEVDEDVKDVDQNIQDLGQGVNDIGQDVQDLGQDVNDIGQDSKHLGQDVQDLCQDVNNTDQDLNSGDQYVSQSLASANEHKDTEKGEPSDNDLLEQPEMILPSEFYSVNLTEIPQIPSEIRVAVVENPCDPDIDPNSSGKLVVTESVQDTEKITDMIEEHKTVVKDEQEELPLADDNTLPEQNRDTEHNTLPEQNQVTDHNTLKEENQLTIIQADVPVVECTIQPTEELIDNVNDDAADTQEIAIHIQVESEENECSVDGNLPASSTTYIPLPKNIQLRPGQMVPQHILQRILRQSPSQEVEPTYEEDDNYSLESAKVQIDIQHSNEDGSYVRQGFRFRCEFCSATFDKLVELKNHLVKYKHSMDRENKDGVSDPFVCKVCGHRFKYKHNMKHHMSRHLSVKPFVCMTSGCSKRFSTKADLLIHHRTHSGVKPYVCEYCQKGFSQSSNLMTHKRSVHNEEFLGGARNHPCPSCDKKFKTKDMMQKHLKRHYQMFTCSQCDEQFRLRKDLQKHTEDIHQLEGFIPAKEDGDNIDLYQCSHCKKSYMDLCKLNQHLKVVHQKDKRYSCSMDGCPYTAYFKYAVERHYLKVHVDPTKNTKLGLNNKKKFMCVICEVPFVGFRSLGIHMKKAHSHTGPFTYDDALKSMAEVPASDDSDPNTDDMVLKDIKKEETEDPKLQDKNETDDIIKLKHRRVKGESPTEYKCVKCSVILGSEWALTQHSKVHNSKEPRDMFTCTDCSKTFSQKAHLTRHTIQYHSKKTRFKCLEQGCTYRCYYASQMKEHFKFKHKQPMPVDETVMKESSDKSVSKNLEDSNQVKVVSNTSGSTHNRIGIEQESQLNVNNSKNSVSVNIGDRKDDICSQEVSMDRSFEIEEDIQKDIQDVKEMVKKMSNGMEESHTITVYGTNSLDWSKLEKKS